MNDSNSTAQITMIDQQNPNHKTSEPETRLSNYYQDRVSGFLQFKSLADRIALHTNLAKIYEGLNALSLSSEHLLQAIAFTPFKDLLAEQILRLAHDLNDDDRYLEALAAVEEASFRSHHLSPLENHMMRYYEPKVFACVVNTNLERYQIALINAKTILEHMSLGIFIFQHMHVVEELITIFSRPREFKRILDRLKKYWQKLYKIRNGIEKSETTNDLPDIKTVIRLIDESCKLYHDISYDQTKNQNNYLDTWLDTIYRQSAAIILQDVSEYAYLICELKNTISFNNAELGLDLDDAVEMANYATQVLDYLIRCAPQFIPWQLSKRLGQYYDTRAWALFRMENSKVIISNSEGSLAKKRKQPKDIKLALNEPQKLLLNEALARDSSSAVIYYHLARISIAQLEVIWQSLPAEKRLLADVDSQTAHEISLCLRQALLYWRQATRLAKGNGLTVRLRLVRQRIEDYRNEWNKLQTPSIMWGSAIVDKLQDYPAKQ